MEIFLTNLLVIGSVIIAFIIMRGFLFWYWRIDEMVALLEQIEENTRIAGAGRTLDLKKGVPRVFGKKARTLVLKKFRQTEPFTDRV